MWHLPHGIRNNHISTLNSACRNTCAKWAWAGHKCTHTARHHFGTREPWWSLALLPRKANLGSCCHCAIMHEYGKPMPWGQDFFFKVAAEQASIRVQQCLDTAFQAKPILKTDNPSFTKSADIYCSVMNMNLFQEGQQLRWDTLQFN